MKAVLLVIAALAVNLANAANIWDACGAGAVCTSGLTCVMWSSSYSQCVPLNPAGVSGGGGGTTTVYQTTTQYNTVTQTNTQTVTTTLPGGGTVTSTRTVTTTPASCSPTGPTPTACANPNVTKFQYFGVNEAGAEFGPDAIPGTYGTDYTFPSADSINFFIDQGFNTIRLPFLLERAFPPSTGLAGDPDPVYFGTLNAIVGFITSKSAYVVLDPHNYLRYNGDIIGTADFSAFWWTIASAFKGNDHVIFDLINEPYGVSATDVYEREQAAIFTIRAAGAASQLVLVEGTAWSGAWSWSSSGNADAFAGFMDPGNNFAFDLHQYLDDDSSGSSDQCVNPAIGAIRVGEVTGWLDGHGFKAFLGEFGGGSNDVCVQAIQTLLCVLQSSNVWIGATYWAAGPWWGDYFQSIEPPDGASIPRILPEALLPFL